MDHPPPAVATTPAADAAEGGPMIRELGHIPPELGVLFLLLSVAGFLVPGPIGAPLLLAGGVALWPSAFGRVEHWFARRFPAAHREGILHIDRYLTDLERRYPGSRHPDA